MVAFLNVLPQLLHLQLSSEKQHKKYLFKSRLIMISFNMQGSFARCQKKLGRAEEVFEGGITMLT